MRALAARWLSGDERTFGLVLATGVLVMAFFRLDRVRQVVGVAPSQELPLVMVVVAASLAWWSMLSRSFVWLDPAELTWCDFGAVDRERLIVRRLVGGWVARMLVLGYLLALLAAVAGLDVDRVLGGVAVLVAAGLLALGTVRRVRTGALVEALVVVAVAALAVVLRPRPEVLYALAAVLGAAGVARLVGSGPLTRPPVCRAGRRELVQGWRDRLLRTVGVHFLDAAMLLPAARPVRGWRLRGPTGVRMAWVGVAARARHLPTAALLALTAVAAHLTFPALLDELVFALLGYLAVVPLAGGLGELWRSPGRRRWLGRSDTALRGAHLLVLTALATAWAVPVHALAALAGVGWTGAVPLTVPLVAACAVRTVTGDPPAYDNPAPVDTPMGSMPLRLIARTLRGPDLGLLPVLFVPVLPVWGGALVVAAAVAVAVWR